MLARSGGSLSSPANSMSISTSTSMSATHPRQWTSTSSANCLQISQRAQRPEILAMRTERWARLLTLTDYGSAVGNPADFVVTDAGSPEQAVAETRQPLGVFKRGRRTVKREPAELVRPG